eukprot:765863-Hanusia_phi.AAC.3
MFESSEKCNLSFQLLVVLLVLSAAQAFTPACTTGPLSIGANRHLRISSLHRGNLLRNRGISRSGSTSLKALGGDAAAKLKQTIRDYGVAAVLTHAIVWVTCLVMGYTLLSNVDIRTVLSFLPENFKVPFCSFFSFHTSENFPKEDIDETSASGLIRFQLTIAALELIGPARLGFTLAVTPTVSGVMRKYQTSRDLEALIVRSTRKTVRSLKVLENIEHSGWWIDSCPFSSLFRKSSSRISSDG